MKKLKELKMTLNETNTIKEKINRKNYISFRVDDVELSNKQLDTYSLRENFVFNIGKEKPLKDVDMSFMFSPPHKPYKLLGISEEYKVLVESKYSSRSNPILRAVNDSFNNHLPLTFSPDIIWQTIIGGVSQHINKYPDSYRNFLVFHKDKKDLVIFKDDLSCDDFERICKELPSICENFISLLEKNTSKIHFDLLQTEFSTTTVIEQTAAAITSMELFSPYFSYTMMCGCGFPEIRLEGTLNDWIKLRSKIDNIEELFYISPDINLTWWTEKLKKITNHFILAAKGEPDISWWKNMYKQMNIYLSTRFNGWIGWFFPYTKTSETWNGKEWVKPKEDWERNLMLDNIDNNILIKTKEHETFFSDPKNPKKTITKKIDATISNIIFNDNNQRNFNLVDWSSSYEGSCFMSTSEFPLGISKVDLKIKDIRQNKEYNTILVGGLFGVTQNTDGNLKPLIGYGLLI